MRALSSAKVNQILSLLDRGLTHAQIHQRTGVSTGSISKICSEHCPYLPKAPAGRRKKLSETDVRHATRLVTGTKSATAVQATREIRQATGKSVHPETVRRALKGQGLQAVEKKKAPALSEHHKKERLEFAQRHKDFTIEDWKRGIFSDEVKINCLGSDGMSWAWKRAGERRSSQLVKPTVKYGGGSLMLWGCMLWEGVGYCCKIENTLNGELYTQILDDELLKTLRYYKKSVRQVFFQQDNDSKHTCKLAQQWFKDHGFHVLVWPAHSPDLNPIEHLWAYLKRKLNEYEEPPKGILELWERVEEEWEKIPVELCQKLIASMPERIQAVIDAKGDVTDF
jgi:transposase